MAKPPTASAGEPLPEGGGWGGVIGRQLPFYEKGSGVKRLSSLQRTAATYSPNWWVSTIGDGEFNFSVRNGKRWDLTAIATAVYRLREKTLRSALNLLDPLQGFAFLVVSLFLRQLSLRKVYRAISTGRLNITVVHLLPINVVVSHDPQGNPHLGDGFALRCFQRLS